MKKELKKLNLFCHLRQLCKFAVAAVTATGLSVFTPSAFAEPRVELGAIVVPDDGNWYEVQFAENYLTICEGQLRCSMRSGYYNVINHSTGARYENLFVPGRPQSGGNPPDYQVDGSVVSFWLEGIYQVQERGSARTVCEGSATFSNSLRCDLPSGLYNFIHNRTDGSTRRFDNVPVPTPFQIDGRSVQFTVPGWFQVQDISTYATLCEGPATPEAPLQCEVAAGRYNFVYISTDSATNPMLLPYAESMRFENITVY